MDASLEPRNGKEQGQSVEVTDPEGKRPPTLGEAASARRSSLSRLVITVWWYCMLLVFASAVAESALASRYLGTPGDDEKDLAADERR